MRKWNVGMMSLRTKRNGVWQGQLRAWNIVCMEIQECGRNGYEAERGGVGNGANFRAVFLHPEFWLSSSWPPLIAHAHVAAFLADNPMNMVLHPHLTSVWSTRAARQGFWAVLRPQRSFPVTLFQLGPRIWARGIQDGHAKPCTGKRKKWVW